MGSVVKHVTSALTGHSGGGESKSSESATKNETQQSWLEKNPQYQALQNNALAEANKFNMPSYQLAGQNANTTSALNKLAQGVDTSQYTSASNLMMNQGQSSYQQGTDILSGAYGTLNQLGNMSQSDYQSMLKGEYNSDLVNSQKEQLTHDLNDQYQDQVQQLNQQASSTGNMGNSRAGVAQGRLAGAEQKALASGLVQYQTAEESAAAQRLNSYLGLRSSSAGQLASIGSQQQQIGLNMYGAGMGYYSQYNQATTQNAQNQLTAGTAQQQYAQQQLDVARQNAIMSQSPALTRLAYYNQTLLPMANLSTYGNSTGTSNSTSTSPSTGGNLLGGLGGMGMSALGSYMGMGSGGSGMMGMFGSAFGNSYGS